MTLLSHFSDPLHTSGRSLRAYRHAEGAGTPAHPGAAGALTGIIALKTAVYLSHLNY